MKYLLPLFALFLLCGCSQEQVDRAKAAQASAVQNLARVEAARDAAAAALAQIKIIAAQIDSEKGQAMVAKAESYLTDANSVVLGARAFVEKTGEMVVAAEKSHAAGGSTLDVLIALLTIGVPSLGVAAAAIRKAITSGTAMRQTVSGLNEARKSMGDLVWDAHVAPALEGAQDEKVKVLVDKIIAETKAA